MIYLSICASAAAAASTSAVLLESVLYSVIYIQTLGWLAVVRAQISSGNGLRCVRNEQTNVGHFVTTT